MQRPPPRGRYARALIPRDGETSSDPRDREPNANLEGPNVPPSTVGPTSSEGFGNTHVMYKGDFPPPQAEAWSGWPLQWQMPLMEPTPTSSTFFGYGNQFDLWGRVSTVMTCVDLNSRQLASFPTYGMKASTPFTLPAWSSNPEPELYSSWSEFMHEVVNSLLLRGEAFQWATGRFADGRVARFVSLNPDHVDVELIDGALVYTLAGEELDAADVAHIKFQSWPGRLRGISPLEWIGNSLETSSALERYASKLATRGGIPWSVLKSQANISSQQATEAQDLWVKAAWRRDGAPAVIGGLFDLQPVTISPRDMALLELREFDERRICAAFGVPAYLVNVEQTGGMTYANASDLRVAHWQSTLRPLAGSIAEVWSSWLLPHGSRMEFNPDRYVQPPLGERAQAYQTLFNIVDPASGERAMTVAEIRAAERLVPEPVESLVEAERLTGASV